MTAPSASEDTPVPVALSAALRAATWVFLLALVVRVAWTAWATVTPLSDFAIYDDLGTHWLETGQYGMRDYRARKPPLYPALLAGTYAVVGHSPQVVAYMQAVMGAATAAMVVLLAAHGTTLRVAVTAGILYALWPTALAYTPVLASENLTTFLLMVTLLSVAGIDRGRGFGTLAWAVLAGGVFGALLLTRSAALFCGPAIGLLVLYSPLRRSWRPVSAVVFCLATGVVLTPWIVRNYSIGLGFTPLTTHGGRNLWMGNNSVTRFGGWEPRMLWPEEGTEKEQDRRYKDAASQWVRSHPWRYLQLCAVRAVRLVSGEPDPHAVLYFDPGPVDHLALTSAYTPQMTPNPGTSAALRARHDRIEQHARSYARWLGAVVHPLCLLALTLAVSRWRAFALPLLPVVSYLVLLCLTNAQMRFREMAYPLLLIAFAALLVDLLSNTSVLGQRPSRYAKLLTALAVLHASLFLHANDIIQDWLGRGTRPVPAPAVGTVNLTPCPFDAPATAYRTLWNQQVDAEVTVAPEHLACELRTVPGASGPIYGGVGIHTTGCTAFAFDLHIDALRSVERVYVDAHDAAGERVARWRWDVTPESILEPPPAHHVFVPNHPVGYFTVEQESETATLTALQVFVELARDGSTTLELGHLQLDRRLTPQHFDPTPCTWVTAPLELASSGNSGWNIRTVTFADISTSGVDVWVQGAAGDEGGQYGGVVVPLRVPTDTVRLSLSVHAPAALRTLYIDAHDLRGAQIGRWTWVAPGQTLGATTPAEYTLRLGTDSAGFRYEPGASPGAAADRLEIFVEVTPGQTTGFAVQSLASGV